MATRTKQPGGKQVEAQTFQTAPPPEPVPAERPLFRGDWYMVAILLFGGLLLAYMHLWDLIGGLLAR